ncbi:MAG: hypothetical protein ACPG66_02455 [Flavobacteriales bacterium]
MELKPSFEQYDAIFGDDPETYMEFLNALEETLVKSKAKLVAAADSEDWNVISATRHSLKPTMTLLKADPLNALLNDWRPTMSALDAAPLEKAMDVILAAVSEKKAGLG